EHGEEAVDAGVVALLSQRRVLRRRLHQVALRLQLRLPGAARGKRVGHFPERRLNALLVLGHADVAAYLGEVQVGAQAAAGEDRQVDLRHEAPDLGTAVEQAVQFGAGDAAGRGQTNRWEEGRARRADVGVGRQQTALGGTDV